MRTIMKKHLKSIAILMVSSCGPLLAMESTIEDQPKAAFKYRDTSSGRIVQVTKKLFFPVFPADRDPAPFFTLPEGCYFSEQTTETRYALLGPLNPCIGIIIRDPNSGKIFMAHKDHASKLDFLTDILLKEFSADSFARLKITLYSEEAYVGDEQKMLRAIAYNNMSQRDELKRTKDFFVELFKIERTQVEALKFAPKFNGFQCELNINLTSNLLIDISTGKIFHIDPFERRIFSISKSPDFLAQSKQEQLEIYSGWLNNLNCHVSRVMRGTLYAILFTRPVR
jgi:hypothetical protein